ncbi:unnamed protein product [Linum tenue]|uniref:Uncharacterized protein n=1 Tax=Linum tenue TaxID=586396 RepID=A0AAV0H974_9ROSI|nr:unnamed protein product [Linum tenue]
MAESNHNATRNPTEFQVTKGNPSLVPPAQSREKGSVYFLSNVDDVFCIIRIVYCFKSDRRRGSDCAAEVIRDALGKVLVHYYPMAGRLVLSPEGKPTLNCSGEGVVFVEAEADCGLEDVDFSRPFDRFAREKLVVYDLPGVPDKFEIPLIAQVTRFKCGGLVVGISFNHLLGDGQAIAEFVNSWSETARGLPLSVPPFLDRTILRSRTPPKIEFRHSEFEPLQHHKSSAADEQITTHRYIRLTPEMIKRAKSNAIGATLSNHYSTYEAIFAFAWRARNRALKTVPDQLTRLLLVVNTRGKFEPPLPKGYFGNALNFAAAHSLAGDLVGNPVSYAAVKIREAIGRVSDRRLRSVIDYCEVTTRANNKRRPSGYGKMVATAMSRLPFSAADFGWGKPISCLLVEPPSDDNMVLFDHPTEKGSLILFIALPGQAMVRFERLVEEELCHTINVTCGIRGLAPCRL